MLYYKLSLDKKNTKLWRKDKFCRCLKRKKCPIKPVEVVFQPMLKRFRTIRALRSVYSGMKITSILDEVISNEYFGNTENRKRFYHLVKKITTQSRYECVYPSSLTEGYNLNEISWLQKENLNETQSIKLLQTANMYILDYIVKPLIKHFYHPLKMFKDYEVRFVERGKWHSFQRRNLNKLLQSGHLILDQNTSTTPRGVLRIFPKRNCDSLEFRPIICPYKRNNATKMKLRWISRQIKTLASQFSTISSSMSLYEHWKEYTIQLDDEEIDEIYAIKLDIKDAFGSVDITKLCQVINESSMLAGDKTFLLNYIQNQFVVYNGKTYKWTHGLLQGDCLSSSLCNLYLSVLEKEHLQCFTKHNNFLHRFVDDYMFCSPNKSEIDEFEAAAMNMLELNVTKTQRAEVGGNSQIIHCGQVFNFSSLEVSRYHKFTADKSIRHKFKFWNIKFPVLNKEKLIMKALKFSYNHHSFKNIELNTWFNTERCVLSNYFEGMIFIAYKFDAVVMAAREYNEEAMPYLKKIINTVIFTYSNICLYKIRKNAGMNNMGNITFKMLKNIGYRAFILVLKRNQFYKTIIENLRSENNLYLNLFNAFVDPKTFTKLPSPFSMIKINRQSVI